MGERRNDDGVSERRHDATVTPRGNVQGPFVLSPPVACPALAGRGEVGTFAFLMRKVAEDPISGKRRRGNCQPWCAIERVPIAGSRVQRGHDEMKSDGDEESLVQVTQSRQAYTVCV